MEDQINYKNKNNNLNISFDDMNEGSEKHLNENPLKLEKILDLNLENTEKIQRDKNKKKIVNSSSLVMTAKQFKSKDQIEDNIKKKTIKSKNELLQERANINKTLLHFVTIIHTVLFVLVLTTNVYVEARNNDRKFLIGYFNIDIDNKYETKYSLFDYPVITFTNLVDLIQKGTFWFKDNKYEIVSNIRVTQRINNNKNTTSSNLKINQDLKNQIYLYGGFNSPIDPYSGFNPKIEYDQRLNNKYDYQKQNSKL